MALFYLNPRLAHLPNITGEYLIDRALIRLRLRARARARCGKYFWQWLLLTVYTGERNDSPYGRAGLPGRCRPMAENSRWSRPAGYGSVLKMAMPLVISISSATLQQFVDRMFLAWYSPEAMAAANAGRAAPVYHAQFFHRHGELRQHLRGAVSRRRAQRTDRPGALAGGLFFADRRGAGDLPDAAGRADLPRRGPRPGGADAGNRLFPHPDARLDLPDLYQRHLLLLHRAGAQLARALGQRHGDAGQRRARLRNDFWPLGFFGAGDRRGGLGDQHRQRHRRGDLHGAAPDAGETACVPNPERLAAGPGAFRAPDAFRDARRRAIRPRHVLVHHFS